MADWAQKNRDHFNNTASTYNAKFSKTILQLLKEIQARKDWIGVDWIDEDDESSASQEKSVRLLDYACGTGLVSRALAPSITSATGIDLSPSMVQEYNTSVSNQGIPEEEMHAVVGNLIDISSPPGPEFELKAFYDFDIAAVGLGWHHFTDPSYAAKQLAARLKVGGVLLIIDFLPHAGFDGGHEHGHSHDHHAHSHDHHAHSHHHSHEDNANDQGHEEKLDGYGEDKHLESAAADTVTHLGFAEEDIKKMFTEAGVGVDFDFVVLGKGVVFEKEGKNMKREVFMAKGRKE